MRPDRTRRRIYLSDLHLDSARDARFARFSECLRAESLWAEEIVILGDLFEMWIGDDDDSELAGRACASLLQASANCRVLAMHGNRDFLCGSGFVERSGANLIEDPHRTDDGVLLSHGDALCTADRAYAELRARLRSEAWRRDMLARPLSERRRIGAEMRAASIAGNANKSEHIMDVTPAEAQRLSSEQGASVLIHGHTHRPGVHRHARMTRYVLGNWDRCGWILRQQGHRFDLECFSLAVRYRPTTAITRPES